MIAGRELAGLAQIPQAHALGGQDVDHARDPAGGADAEALERPVIAHDEDVELAEFVKLGAMTVPAGLVVGTAGLWLGLRVV